jgi:glycosyltransferase involved in cell wall biosynthesis
VNIYLYARHFPPEGDRRWDGVVKAVHGLASGLVQAGAKVTVLSEGSAIANTTVETAAGYTIACFQNPIQTRPALRLSPDLQAYIAQLPADSLVILNGIFHLSVYALSRCCRRHGIPYINAPHDVYSPMMFGKKPLLKWSYWWLLEKRMLQQAAAVQVLDIRQKERFVQLGIHRPVLAIPNGVTPEGESVNFWYPNSIPKLFFFGRLDRYHKGLDLLLSAFRQLVQHTAAELTLQGFDEGDRAQLEHLAQDLQNVTFLEPEQTRSPVAVISEYDVFCLPSRFEGFGLAALEAMVAGRVLLVSEEAGIAPHVKASGCGVVVKPEVNAIHQGLLELLQRRSQWLEMGERGRQYALEELNWQHIGRMALAAYQSR